MAELRRFLRQAQISSKLSIGVQKEALERLMEIKPLMVTDAWCPLKLLDALLYYIIYTILCMIYTIFNTKYILYNIIVYILHHITI